MLNGKLQSVSEDIYDSFILREIAEQPEQFKMAIVIGNVLGKYQLGISDVWISKRLPLKFSIASRFSFSSLATVVWGALSLSFYGFPEYPG